MEKEARDPADRVAFFKGGVSRGVVDNQDVDFVSVPKFDGNPEYYLANGLFSVVSNNENENSRLSAVVGHLRYSIHATVVSVFIRDWRQKGAVRRSLDEDDQRQERAGTQQSANPQFSPPSYSSCTSQEPLHPGWNHINPSPSRL